MPCSPAESDDITPEPRRRRRLRLVAAQPFDCGIAALHFEPKRA
jgi:hypothetical protein